MNQSTTDLMSGLEANFGQTPSQTVGPYFAYGLTATQYGYDFDQPFDHRVALDGAAGERIRVEGRVIDGDGKPISDALVELCQVDGQGRYPKTVADATELSFRGFGRCGTGTDPELHFWFDTVKPGPEGKGQAPHLNLIVMMRGLLLHAFSRVYFDDEPTANATDPVLKLVPAARRGTLLARRSNQSGRVVYRFDIHMQGAQETVFFDV